MYLLRMNEIPTMLRIPVVCYTWLAVFICFALVKQSPAFEGCTIEFGRRACSHRHLKGVIATCDGGGIESRVPHNLPNKTVFLSLTDFNFSRTLVRSDFARLNYVECLTIVNSVVSGIEPDTFSGMDAMVELNLDNTTIHPRHLHFIAHPTFQVELLSITKAPNLDHIPDIGPAPTFAKLKSLILSRNSLKRIPSNFHLLGNLEKLDLSGNRLRHLHWDMFSNMEKLHQLKLDGNLFQTIPESMLTVFFAVKELKLADNPWHCNCYLVWLKNFLGGSGVVDKILDSDQVHCYDPHLAPILSNPQPEANFKCIGAQKPAIYWKEMEDGRVEVNCTSRGDPSPTLRVTLHLGSVSGRRSRDLIIPPSTDLAELNTSSPQLLTRPGVMLCEASNIKGISFTEEFIGPDFISTAPLRSSSYVATLGMLFAWVFIFNHLRRVSCS